ncbi:MAG TPA: ABC transporter ATP-binding protein [Ktedonobacteraceae bacterium]
MIQALETEGLGKRYGRTWALRDCTLRIPIGCISGLVGPNGAGKTTLLHMAVGLLMPTSGTLKVLGYHPGREAKQVLSRVGFVAQELSLYKTFRVEEMLALGRKLNATWDQDMALRRLKQLGIPLRKPIGKLSVGQRSQVALILALAKRPELVLLDEPFASLDPLARREFQQLLMETVADDGLSAIISSHIVADLERFCDHLVILSASHVQIAGRLDRLLQSHKLLVGPRERAQASSGVYTILTSREAARQCTLLVQTHSAVVDPCWEVHDVSLEEIILAYLSQPGRDMAEPEGEKGSEKR